MNDIDRALSQIADIRAQMAASTRFHGFAPKAVALTGLIAFAVAAAQALWPETLAQDHLRYVLVWVVVAVNATAIVASEVLSRSHRMHGGMADAMIGGTLRLFLPFGAAGAIVTFVICTVSPQTAWALPGLWQILIALLGFAAIPNLPRTVAWGAGWYLLTGTVVLALAGRDGILSPWMMGVPFFVGQSLVALALHNAARDGDA